MSENIFWMVYGLHQNSPVRRHKTEQSALIEAKRLARQSPEVDFFVLKAIAHIVKRDVDVTLLTYRQDADDNIPF